MASDRAGVTVGHAIGVYLPHSATFIHTLLRFQLETTCVVLAGRTANLELFPTAGPVVDLGGDLPRRRRAGRRLAARARGARTAYAARIAREAARHRCALLHAHWGPMGWTALTAKRRLGIPLVTTFYGYDLAAPLRDRRWRRRYRELFAHGDAFLCEGPAMGARLSELGCPPEKVAIARIGLDLADFPFSPRRRSSPLIVVQCARFEEKKGVDVSIRAFAAARDRLGPSELWLVGDGPLRPQLEALATRLRVAGAVRFLGLLAPADYRAVLERAHLGIQPSRTASDGDTEGGAPTVLLEMQATGIPVVATRHADIPAIVADSVALVDENDAGAAAAALVRLAHASEAELADIATAGRALVEAGHDAARTAAAVEAVYRELLGG